jgi:hypothetical protein
MAFIRFLAKTYIGVVAYPIGRNGKGGKEMFRHIGRYFVLLAAVVAAAGAAAVFADEGCEPGKSLFLNISSERPSNVQIALVVADANASGGEPGDPMTGQSADIQLFFSNAAAAYAIYPHATPDGLSEKQVKRLDKYLRKEFGYRVEDIVRLQGIDEDLNGEDMPDIRSLQDDYAAQVLACSFCIAEALTAAGVEGVDPRDAGTFTRYLIPDSFPMSPSAFYLIYDRIDGEGADCVETSASVMSF